MKKEQTTDEPKWLKRQGEKKDDRTAQDVQAVL